MDLDGETSNLISIQHVEGTIALRHSAIIYFKVIMLKTIYPNTINVNFLNIALFKKRSGYVDIGRLWVKQ